MKKIKKIILFLFIILILGGYFYVNDYYEAIDQGILESEIENIEIIKNENELIVKPVNPEIGFIFYPGGKVEYLSYESMLVRISNEDILTIVPKMPFNLSVFGINKADEIMENFPEIKKWYIGGHSLGGSMAGVYASKNVELIEGLILLGSYITSDLSDKDLEVLSIYGSEDKILNYESYLKNKTNLPKDFIEIKIEGGNHAYFGNYGFQEGDKEAKIDLKKQQELTSEYIRKFILK